MEIILLKKKLNATDKGEISIQELLHPLQEQIDAIPIQSKEDIISIVQENSKEYNKVDIENLFLYNDVYDFKHPINLNSGIVNEDIFNIKGLMYYNPLSDKIRVCTNKGWKSLKFED